MPRLTPLAAIGAALAISGCAVTNDLEKVPEPMGRFLLGHTVTVVDEPELGPFSREATDEAWQQAINFAMEERFGRYDGDKYFHIATNVEGYALAMIGIPVAFTPKSILVATVNIWDDEKGGPILEEPEVFTVSEELGFDQLVGTGLTKTADEQMLSLARSLAKSVHEYMLENLEWFGDASLMDPATTSAGTPAATAGTVPPQFARIEDGKVIEAGETAPTNEDEEEGETTPGLIIESSSTM